MKVLNPRRFEMCHFILKQIEALENNRKFDEIEEQYVLNISLNFKDNGDRYVGKLLCRC